MLRLLVITTLSVALSACTSHSDHEDSPRTRSTPPVGIATDKAPALPAASDVDAPESLVSDAFVARFSVSQPTAERFARGYAHRKGNLSPPLRTCLALPKVDASDNQIAWVFVLSHDAKCEGWGALLARARDFTAGRDGMNALGQAMVASATSTFTVAVSAHSFRHPLHEAHRGMPLWVLSASTRRSHDVPRRCTAAAVLPANPTRGVFEVVKYDCDGESVFFDHRGNAPVSLESLPASADPRAAFLRFQRVTKHKHSNIGARLERLDRIWSMYVEEGGVAP